MGTAQVMDGSSKNDYRPYLYVLSYDAADNIGSLDERLSGKVWMRDCVGPA